MPNKVTSLPTASAQLPSGSASASAGALYSDTASAVSAGAELALSPKSHVSARLIRRGLVLAFIALLTIGIGQTLTTAIAKLAHANHMQAKGW